MSDSAREGLLVAMAGLLDMETLMNRRKKRGNSGEISFYWLKLPPYPTDFVINTDGKTVSEIVNEMKELLKTSRDYL